MTKPSQTESPEIPAKKSAAKKAAARKATPKKPAAKKAPAKKAPAKKPAAKKPAAPKKPRAKKPAPPADPEAALARLVRDILLEKKAVDVSILDLRGLSDVSDFIVLASALNAPHIRALSDEVAKRLRALSPSVAPHRFAGDPASGWLVLDYYQTVVHLFSPQMREYYALELLWKGAPVL